MLKTEDTFLLLDKALKMKLEKSDELIPSKIQELAIPSILKGENVLLIAPTGTGKTFAATLPIFNLYLSSKRSEGGSGVSILYITPLRALNRDVFRRISEIGKELGIDVQVRHGDTVQSVRAKQARKPPDMLITTPETIQAILPGKRMKEHLKSVKWVIIDEIHELVDSKRGIQLSLALERLQNVIGNKYQRIGLSATIGDETKIAKLLAGSNKS
ncbi:DEAD/DEAH box helicase, partial [[Eubacterium] cellulosolvens]